MEEAVIFRAAEREQSEERSPEEPSWSQERSEERSPLHELSRRRFSRVLLVSLVAICVVVGFAFFDVEPAWAPVFGSNDDRVVEVRTVSPSDLSAVALYYEQQTTV